LVVLLCCCPDELLVVSEYHQQQTIRDGDDAGDAVRSTMLNGRAGLEAL
jgi:hypothetical protein